MNECGAQKTDQTHMPDALVVGRLLVSRPVKATSTPQIQQAYPDNMSYITDRTHSPTI